jgi:hypothetical protein
LVDSGKVLLPVNSMYSPPPLTDMRRVVLIQGNEHYVGSTSHLTLCHAQSERSALSLAALLTPTAGSPRGKGTLVPLARIRFAAGSQTERALVPSLSSSRGRRGPRCSKAAAIRQPNGRRAPSSFPMGVGGARQPPNAGWWECRRCVRGRS